MYPWYQRQGAYIKLVLRARFKARLNTLALHRTGLLVSQKFAYANYKLKNITQHATRRRSLCSDVIPSNESLDKKHNGHLRAFPHHTSPQASSFTFSINRSAITYTRWSVAITYPESSAQISCDLSPRSRTQLIRQHALPKHYSHAYAAFIEAGMVATHGAPSHSTYNKINQLPGSTCKVLEPPQITQSPRMVTAPPQSTTSLSQVQSTSHCNLATQMQCSHAKGHIDNSHVTNISSCNSSHASIVPNNYRFASIACNHFKIQNQTTNDKGSTTNNHLPADARGISTAEVNTHCYWRASQQITFACNSHCWCSE